MTKDEKLFLKYKKQFAFLFNDEALASLLSNHFDNNGCYIVFVIAILQNKLEKDKVLNHLKINKDEWIQLFSQLYKNQDIINLYKKLEINPIVPLEQTIERFDCFNPFINELINFLKQHELNTNIHETKIKQLLVSVFGYLLYNHIGCNLPYDIEKILTDHEYDTKYTIILNNTKLFASAKKQIIEVFGETINDLIVLLLGMNKQLNLDK